MYHRIIQLACLMLILGVTITSSYAQFDNCYFIQLWRIGHLHAGDVDSLSSDIDKLTSLESKYKQSTPDLYFRLAKLYQEHNDRVKKNEYARKYLAAGGELDEVEDFIGFTAPEKDSLSHYFQSVVLGKRNAKYIEWIDEFYGFDQNNRRILHPGADSFFKTYLTRADSFTASSFQAMVQQNGFPKRNEIGAGRCMKLFVIMLHLIVDCPDDYDYFSTLLRRAVFSGDFDPESYGAVIDRYQQDILKQGQLYGCYNMTTNGFAPIKNVGKADERRAAIGLAPLKEAILFEPDKGYLLPDGYQYEDTGCSFAK